MRAVCLRFAEAQNFPKGSLCRERLTNCVTSTGYRIVNPKAVIANFACVQYPTTDVYFLCNLCAIFHNRQFHKIRVSKCAFPATIQIYTPHAQFWRNGISMLPRYAEIEDIMLTKTYSGPPPAREVAPWLRRLSHTRGIWLRTPGPLSKPTFTLISSSRYAGMELDVLAYGDLPMIPFWRYDLIVLEQTQDQALPTLLAGIKRVRALSKAPLVVLTRRIAPELTIAGLNAGADAVSSLRSSEQVLLAHWCAMLKRWKAA